MYVHTRIYIYIYMFMCCLDRVVAHCSDVTGIIMLIVKRIAYCFNFVFTWFYLFVLSRN